MTLKETFEFHFNVEVKHDWLIWADNETLMAMRRGLTAPEIEVITLECTEIIKFGCTAIPIIADNQQAYDITRNQIQKDYCFDIDEFQSFIVHGNKFKGVKKIRGMDEG